MTLSLLKVKSVLGKIFSLSAVLLLPLTSWGEEHINNEAETQVQVRVDTLLATETEVIELKEELIKIEQELEQKDSLAQSGCRLYVIKQLALLEELSGGFEAAQHYFYKAAKLAVGEEKAAFLFEIARLLVEQGYTAEAKENLVYIVKLSTNSELLAMSLNLEAVIAFLEEGPTAAEQKYQYILEKYKGTAGEIKALLGLVSLNLDNRERADYFLNELKQRAPDAPEYALARNLLDTAQNNDSVKEAWNVQYKMTPLRFFTLFDNKPQEQNQLLQSSAESSSTADLPAGQGGASNSESLQNIKPSENAAIFIQTGSFADKENAEYMISDLKKINFDASLKTATLNNRLYYKVVIGPFATPEKASEELIKLKEKGFEGFLLN